MSNRRSTHRSVESKTTGRMLPIVSVFVCITGICAGIWFMIPANRKDFGLATHQLRLDSATRDAWFENIIETSGIDFRHEAGHSEKYYFPEIMSGGVGLFDFDNDGHLDAYFVQGGSLLKATNDSPRNTLYRNRGDLTFEDVTITSGTGDSTYGMGCTCGDYDNDGDTDLYVTNVGPNVLFRNNGDGTFTDVTNQAGVGDPSFSASAAFLDYDRDGFLDLFVTNYVAWSPDTEIDCRTNDGMPDYCKPTHYNAPALDTLYRNRGDGTFRTVTEFAGIHRAFGNGLGIICGDFNNDGWPDILTANDETANQFWINQGDGTFVDRGPAEGIAYSGLGQAQAGMGVTVWDIDHDLDSDILMTHFAGESNTLYLREAGYWEDATQRFGMTPSRPFTGFGTIMADFNHDGLVDHYVANGRVVVGHGQFATDDSYAEPNLLLVGTPHGVFKPSTAVGGTNPILVNSSRGAAFGDIDNDGGIDVVVVNQNAQPYMLRNLKTREGNWISFDVQNRHGSAAIGARITLTIEGSPRIAEVRAAYSYCASNDPRVHFGLGQVTEVDEVHVRWADGTETEFGYFAANTIVQLRRP